MPSYSTCSLQHVALTGLAIWASLAAALPSDRPDLSDTSIPFVALFGGDVALRILPLGDALTHGTSAFPSSYRAPLRDLLVADGNPVDYVGSSTSGSLPNDDNQVEAPADVGAAPLATVVSAAKTAVPAYKPNIVIIHAGADDCRQGADVSDASARYLEILTTAWTSIFATAVLTTLPPSRDAAVESCLVELNRQIADLVAAQQASSRKVVLVDFRAADAGITLEDLTDDVDGEPFPSEEAYGKMAGLLFEGIRNAASRGWLEAPETLPDAPEEPKADPSSSATGTSAVTLPTDQASGSRLGGSSPEADEVEDVAQGNGAAADQSGAARGVVSGLAALLGLAIGVGMTLV
ncbi:hypothetical protein jhhlp_001098 [Lomentospora prolificans]|uniref:SGNH hydrolase-type esterase domain-containing protein n=1 Tax=Lomentospora prolificans TaxID=41688 RepID=A0A2N3NH94_9PEZI|nr:hypothetical protein jhhlp_001098 [Lomentospora prolificans]